jgi:hypothetical protein
MTWSRGFVSFHFGSFGRSATATNGSLPMVSASFFTSVADFARPVETGEAVMGSGVAPGGAANAHTVASVARSSRPYSIARSPEGVNAVMLPLSRSALPSVFFSSS